MSFFIEPVMAETAAAPSGDPFSLPIMIVIFAAVFYFMIWRPQSKRAKEHKNLMTALSKGDEVVTNGGVVGKVSKVTDDFIILTVNDNTELTFQKASVSSVLPKGTIKAI